MLILVLLLVCTHQSGIFLLVREKILLDFWKHISRAYKFIGKIFGGSARTVINQNWLTVNHFSANGSYFIWGKQRWKAEMKILQWSLQAFLFLRPLWLCLLLTHSLVQNGKSTCRQNIDTIIHRIYVWDRCLMGKLRVFLQMFLLPCNWLISKLVYQSLNTSVYSSIFFILDFFLSDFEDLTCWRWFLTSINGFVESLEKLNKLILKWYPHYKCRDVGHQKLSDLNLLMSDES